LGSPARGASRRLLSPNAIVPSAAWFGGAAPLGLGGKQSLRGRCGDASFSGKAMIGPSAGRGRQSRPD
jgi:hypothetical protein